MLVEEITREVTFSFSEEGVTTNDQLWLGRGVTGHFNPDSSQNSGIKWLSFLLPPFLTVSRLLKKLFKWLILSAVAVMIHFTHTPDGGRKLEFIK